jgi:hypothetical protein
MERDLNNPVMDAPSTVGDLVVRDEIARTPRLE